ncbi:MAG: chemotaxis protein CheW, partial [Thermomicrobiaceae bacterium]|nr:chemotaxis protein CheW [Thermomicrobiaceae bacterium]
VVACGSVEEALARLAADPAFSLVVTDYLLPGPSGLDLVRAIRSGEIPAAREVPVLVMSQHVEPEIADALRAAGADEVVAKFDQLDRSGLLATVRRLLRGRAAQAAAGVAHEVAEADEATAHVLAVNLQREVFGVPVAQVREITTLDGLTPTPLTQAGYLGLANIRGEIIPVFDLGGVLGRADGAGQGRQVDVVVETGLGPVVLRSDGIRGTVKVPETDLRPPVGNLGALAELVPSVVTLSDCLLQVLDLERLAGHCLGRR